MSERVSENDKLSSRATNMFGGMGTTRGIYYDIIFLCLAFYVERYSYKGSVTKSEVSFLCAPSTEWLTDWLTD